MNPNLQNKLFERFPKIFVEKDMTPQESCMHWGITCGDGWFDLLNNMCSEIQELCDKNKVQVVAKQVKEKFAVLTFYYEIVGDGVDRETVYEIIKKYREKSVQTCEETGGVGTIHIRNGSLMKTLNPNTAILLGFKPYAD